MHMTDPEVELISRSNFAFSNALHEQLRINGEEGNLVFSPFSLGLVLLMARFGARGMTAQQLDRVLNPSHNVTMTLDDLVPMIRGCFKVLEGIQNDKSRDYNVTVANRMFTGLGINVKDEFKSIARATLDITTEQLDFTEEGGRPAAEAINSWVSNKTNGKINEIISSDSLTNQTQVVLVNTMHFKAPWKLSFEPRETRNATFHLNSNEQTQVNMMTAEDQYPYGDLQELNATVVVIPYKGERFSMHFYVPKQKNGLNDILRALKHTSMDQIRAQIRKPGNCEEVHFSLPRFKIESKLKLLKPLRKMGAKDMFSSNLANFTGISDDMNVYVSDVVQKAFIAVDEAGTEAAAASSIQAGVTCFPSITIVKADRPFYFQIVDEKMGLVLFAGTVRKPDPAVEEVLVSRPVDYGDEEYGDYPDPTAPNPTEEPTLSPVTAATTESPKRGKMLAAQNQSAPVVTTAPLTTPVTRIRSAGTDTEFTARPLVPRDSTPVERPSRVLNADQKIIFATCGGGIQTYSDVKNERTTVIDSKENFTGVAWDSINQQLYYSGAYAIYRAEIDGTNVQNVLSTDAYGAITGLAYDWITSNLYGVTNNGFIFTCKPLEGASLSCAIVLSRGTRLNGIAVNPNEGRMYWTEFKEHKESCVMRADLDGGNPVPAVRGLLNPVGIAVDLRNSRIIWTDHGEHDIVAIDPNPGNQTNINLRRLTHWAGMGPTGITVLNNGKVFWGSSGGRGWNLYRGGLRWAIVDISDMHVGSPVSHLALATENSPNMTRQNPCDGNECGGICVLTPTHARCLP